MKRGLFISLLLLLTACATSMTRQEFMLASQNCERQNPKLEAEVACLNDFLTTRNAESSDADVYFTWVKERNAIMELYKGGELNSANTRLALINAQNKYETIIANRRALDLAQFRAMEARRPIICRSSNVGGGNVQTICD